MKASRFFLMSTLVLFTFQNCEQTENMDSPTEHPSDFESASIGEPDLSQAIKIRIDNLNVEINLETGVVENSESTDLIGSCLKDSNLNDLRGLLEGNEICQETQEIPEDTLCAMIYTFPYIEIFVSSQKNRVKVGEANSSCPETVTTLCENDDELREAIGLLSFDEDFEDCP